MSSAELSPHIWVREEISPYDVYSHGLTRVLSHTTTRFQEMAIAEAGISGKALVLDGKWQSCTADEFLYHEPLVHPACVTHGRPRDVLTLGGGEGATLREVLRWRDVERATMVDIDGEVVDACKEYLREMHQGAFDDPRTHVVIGDALEYLDSADSGWDVIISDLSDPIEAGPSFKLFTKEYFETCRRALRDDGYFVVQAGPLTPHEMPIHVRLINTLRRVFSHVVSYSSQVPTYASPWGFALCSGRPIDVRPDPEAVDRLLADRTIGGMRMFDGTTLLGLMQQPKHLREAIEAETEVYTLEAPPHLYGRGVGERSESSS